MAQLRPLPEEPKLRVMSIDVHKVCRFALFALAGIAIGAGSAAAADASPPIRLTPQNTIPSCVTPERLMRFIATRNDHLEPRFAEIARWYKVHGTALRVRWDYAFFQMVVETNYLTFRRGNGDPGDVKPRQNNFAGIGTTGGGVPGDAFPDVKTGVLAHIQHLVAYSGEKLPAPVAPRTQLTQNDVVEVSLRLNRPVRFSDLARRWAVDRHYGQSIAAVADRFRDGFCNGQQVAEEVAPPRPEPATRRVAVAAAIPNHLGAEVPPVAPRATTPPPPVAVSRTPVRTIWRADAGKPAAPPRHPQAAPPQPATTAAAQTSSKPTALAPGPSPAEPPVEVPTVTAPQVAPAPPIALPSPGCSIATASYGGKKTLLIRHEHQNAIQYTALSVLDGFERSMTDVFVRDHARGGSSIGEFATRDEALAKARELCPGTQAAARFSTPGPRS